MKKILAAVLMVASCGAFALDIKGIEIGKPLDCDSFAKSTKHYYYGDLASYEVLVLRCKGSIPEYAYGSAKEDWKVKYLQVTFLNGVVEMAVYRNDQLVVERARADIIGNSMLSDAVEGFTAKYGKPRVVSETVQNGYGATAERTTYTWSDEKARLTVISNSGKIGEHSLVLDSMESLTKEMNERKANLGNL
jgi:hypothetical protein